MTLIEIGATLPIAVGAFVSTNGDDFVLLLALFGVGQNRFSRILIGQLVGMAVLVGLSYLGALGLDWIGHSWAHWLGCIPILIGLKALVQKKTSPSSTGVSQNLSVLAVTLLTVANGGDNLGVYVPLFAVQSAEERALTLLVFGVMAVTLCFLARAVGLLFQEARWTQEVIKKLFPFLLMGLGSTILFMK